MRLVVKDKKFNRMCRKEEDADHITLRMRIRPMKLLKTDLENKTWKSKVSLMEFSPTLNLFLVTFFALLPVSESPQQNLWAVKFLDT